MTASARLRIGATVALLLGGGAISKAEDGEPLRITVNPSGYAAPARETIEQKLARRDNDFRFRSICRGCLPAAIEARLEGVAPRIVAELPPLAPPDSAPPGDVVAREAAPE